MLYWSRSELSRVIVSSFSNQTFHNCMYIFINTLYRPPIALTLTYEIYQRMTEDFPSSHTKNPFLKTPKISPTWKAIRHNKLGVVLLAGGSFRECLDCRLNLSLLGETVLFCWNMCKKVNGRIPCLLFFVVIFCFPE